MANKKFYYRNKKKKNDDAGTQNMSVAQYSEEQLSMTLEALGLSDTTRELLEKNNLAKASDLVKRTEKDMYKVQGLNKKILFEVRDALQNNGMAFREVEQPKKDDAQKKANNQNSQKKQNNKQKVDNDESCEDAKIVADAKGVGKSTQKKSKFGIADRKEDKQPQQKAQKQQKQEIALGMRKVMKGGKWGYSNGFKIVIPTMYDEIFPFKEGLASVEIDEKCGYIDENNNVVIPLEYETAMSFSGGLAMVVKGNKCGYINKNNEVIIPFEYDAGTPFENGEAKVKKDGKWGTLTPDNKVVWI